MKIEFLKDATILVDERLYVHKHRSLEQVRELFEEMKTLQNEGKINQNDNLYEINALCMKKGARAIYYSIVQLPVGEGVRYNECEFQRVSKNLYKIILD